MLNNISIVGRLGKDPDDRATKTGLTVSSFNIAVDDGYGDKRQTYWFDVTAFGKTAEYVVKYARKGDLVAISGRLTQRSWDKKDGGKGYAIEIVANTVDKLTPKKDEAKPEEPKPAATNAESIELPEDDLPF